MKNLKSLTIMIVLAVCVILTGCTNETPNVSETETPAAAEGSVSDADMAMETAEPVSEEVTELEQEVIDNDLILSHIVSVHDNAEPEDLVIPSLETEEKIDAFF